MLSPSALNANALTRKGDVLPLALFILAHADALGIPGLKSSALRQIMLKSVVLSEADRAVTPGDSVSRIERTLLNLISHNDLVNRGWAKLDRPGDAWVGEVKITITAAGKAQLFDIMVDLISPDPSSKFDLSLKSGQYHTESDVETNALLAIALLERQEGKPPSSAQWRKAAQDMLDLGDFDKETVGSTSRIERTLINLVSHKTLLKKGWVSSEVEGHYGMTDEGKAHLLNRVILHAIPPPPSLTSMERAAPVQSGPRTRKSKI